MYRTRRIGVLRCFFNYNPFTVQLPALEGLDILIGSADLPPAGVLIGREERTIRVFTAPTPRAVLLHHQDARADETP